MIKAYCINLDRKPENFEKIKKEFEGILDITRVSGIDGLNSKTPGVIALHKTSFGTRIR